MEVYWTLFTHLMQEKKHPESRVATESAFLHALDNDITAAHVERVHG